MHTSPIRGFRPLHALAALSALGLSLAVHAQAATTTTVTTSAPGAAPVSVTTTATSTATAPTVPAPSCTPPAMPTGPLHSKEEAEALNASLSGYQKCIADYSANQKAIADAHMAAANNAVRMFNAFALELNAAVKVPAK